MPVIGRLDDQVNDVLIKPLSKKGDPRDAPAPPVEPPATLPPAAEEHPTGSGDTDAPAELPVWLL
jgi:hypothetical protein